MPIQNYFGMIPILLSHPTPLLPMNVYRGLHSPVVDQYEILYIIYSLFIQVQYREIYEIDIHGNPSWMESIVWIMDRGIRG